MSYNGYKEDLAAAVKRQNDLIVQQVFLEVIRVVTECETYEEFRKHMYGIALSYMKELEEAGYSVPDKSKDEAKTSDSEPSMSDDMFVI